MPEFAPQYARDENDWILFPPDIDERRKFYPHDTGDDETKWAAGGLSVFHHPAKMQLLLTQELIRYYTKPGDSILDPFGGTGTTGWGVLVGRDVTLMELEPVFQPLLEYIKENWVSSWSTFQATNSEYSKMGELTLLFGDSNNLMKQLPTNSINAIITSPPYANLQVGKETEREQEFVGGLRTMKEQMRQYGSDKAHPANFGRYNTFQFNLKMQAIYNECFRVLVPGGVYVSVTKDSMRGNQRQLLATEVSRYVRKSGLVSTGDWYKWKTPGGMMSSVMKSKGSEVVEDEDVVVYRKP